MKNALIVLFVYFFCVEGFAQIPETQKYLLTTKSNTFGFSTISFLDPYLSPLTYSGNGIQFNHESRRFLSLENTNISIQKKYYLLAGFALNPPQTSSMLYLGTNYSWGMHYHFRPIKGLQLLAGGSWDIDFGYKYVVRNINNPVNVDLATNLNLSGIAMYDIPLRRRTLRLQLAVETPVFGWMFVPLAGESDYEMFDLGNLSNVSHLSSIINKRGINPKLTIDVPFSRTTWQFGLSYQKLKYKANDMVFERNEFSISAGTTFDEISFSGRKRHIPQNFISTNE
ncbi:MAG: DUF3316 domain-containing protein [Paludibacter sp.]|nr:DUF3316 domain-containing protein [Paludibacter sp.]